MANGVKPRTTSLPGGLESLVIEHPHSSENRDSLLMLVTGMDKSGVKLQRKLIEMGYIVATLPTFALAIQYLNKAYVDGVVLDAYNTVPTKTDVTARPDSYKPGTGEIYTFLTQLHAIDPELGVSLVTTSGDPNEYHIPIMSDLVMLGVKVTKGTDERFRPFAVEELSEPEFSSSLMSLLNNRAAHLSGRISEISSSLPKSPSYDRLSLNIGDAVSQVYNRFSAGGTALVTDAITVGGAFAPISPTKQYPNSARTFHIKRVTEPEARGFAETHGAVTRRFKELGRCKPKTPAPLGYHVTADGTAFSVKTFVMGSSYSEVARVINPNSPQHTPDPDGLSALIWEEMLQLALGRKIPEWHEVTHPMILEERHKGAREGLPARQADQLLLVPEHLPEITGRSLDQQQKQDYRAAVAELYRGFPISDSSLVLPMSSKGQNLALETFQSIPTADLLRKRYLTGDQVNTDKLERDFAFWDFNTFGRVGTAFSDIYSLVNDPRLYILQAERPRLIFTALQKIFPEQELIQLYDELFGQGIHHSMLKAQQTAIQAQVNEYRFAIGRVRDPESYVKERESLQTDFTYFLGEALKHVTLSCTAKSEDWQGRKLSPFDVIELMTEHYTSPDRWLSCSLTNGKSRSFAYLPRLHAPIAKMYSEPELSTLDTERLRENALRGNFLTY